MINGFLITNLIATEILTTGRLRLDRFYRRRARRLLPTVLTAVLVVVLASHHVWTDQRRHYAEPVASTLGYVTN